MTAPEVPEFLAGVGSGALADRMGIVLTEMSAARVVATMPVEGNTQPFGLLHGGASVVLAESAASVAAAIHAGPGRTAVGVEVNATHHRGVRHGVVTAVASALHLGRTVATYAVTLTDETGDLTCTARITCLLRDLPGADAGEAALSR